MPTDVITLVEQFVHKLLGDHATAVQYAGDPHGTLAANGLTEHSLDGVDMRQVVGQVCSASDVSPATRAALQSYTSGGGSSSGGYAPPSGGYERQSVEQVMQHLNYVTYVSYSDDHSITENLDNSTHIDQSTDISVDGPVSGDISVDNHSANATGDGAVAGSGDGDVTAATGDQSQAIGGNVLGQANTGDGAVQQIGLGGRGEGGGGFGPVNTGTNSGVIADGDVHDTVVGDHNQSVQGTSATGSVIDFGSGAVSNASGNTVTDGAVSAGGDAQNTSHDTVDHGSALATGASSASGNENIDVDVHLPHPHPVLEHDPVLRADAGHESGGVEHLATESHYAPAHVEEPVQHEDPTALPDHHG